MNTKHSPGPWSVSYPAITGGPYRIFGPDRKNKKPFAIGNVYGALPREEFESNAKLVAAAPELLALLKDFVKAVNNNIKDKYTMGDESFKAWAAADVYLKQNNFL